MRGLGLSTIIPNTAPPPNPAETKSKERLTMSKSDQEREISNSIYGAGTEMERSSKVYLRTLVPSDQECSVLDVGCGTGLNASHLKGMGHKVTGVDLSPVAIEKFKAAGFDGEVCDVIEGLPFKDDTFDIVFSSEVIEHLADTDRFLNELKRVLRPNGLLILSTPNSAFWVFRVLGLLGQTATEIQHPGHIRFFSVASLRDHLAATGFQDVEVSARHMYMVMPDTIGKLAPGLWRALGFTKEFRYKTQTYFWHLSRFARRASGFWADTMLLKAKKSPRS